MKPTQNNRPQGPWRRRLMPAEAKTIELLEWQIGVIDLLRQDLARRRQRIQNTACKRRRAA